MVLDLTENAPTDLTKDAGPSRPTLEPDAASDCLKYTRPFQSKDSFASSFHRCCMDDVFKTLLFSATAENLEDAKHMKKFNPSIW